MSMYNQTAVLPISKERAAYLQKQKRKSLKPPTIFSVKFATFSKRNNFKARKNSSAKQRQKSLPQMQKSTDFDKTYAVSETVRIAA